MCWKSIRCDLGNAVSFPTPFHLVVTQLLTLQNSIWAATHWVQPFPAANHVSCLARYSQSNKTGDIGQACYQKTEVGSGRKFQQLWKLVGGFAVGITDPASECSLATHIHRDISHPSSPKAWQFTWMLQKTLLCYQQASYPFFKRTASAPPASTTEAYQISFHCSSYVVQTQCKAPLPWDTCTHFNAWQFGLAGKT